MLRLVAYKASEASSPPMITGTCSDEQLRDLELRAVREP